MMDPSYRKMLDADISALKKDEPEILDDFGAKRERLAQETPSMLQRTDIDPTSRHGFIKHSDR